MNLAPILIQVYTRKAHFINCVESLSQCKLADKSHLFIVSDGPKTEKDMQVVEEIRKYCETIKGFAKIDLLAWESNLGVLKSLLQAEQRIFSKYSSMIYTGDDNIFSQNFLEFMNEGLRFYNNNPRVFSICGHKHPFEMPKGYTYDVFASTMMSAWGFGIWKDKYLSVDFYPKRLDVSNKQFKKMSYTWQNLMLDVISNHKVYGDAIMEYHCVKYHMVNIFPVISLVQNHGNDGSGMHCKVVSGYSTQEICTEPKTFSFINDLTIHANVEKRVVDAINFPFKSAFQKFYLKPLRKFKYVLLNLIYRNNRIKLACN